MTEPVHPTTLAPVTEAFESLISLPEPLSDELLSERLDRAFKLIAQATDIRAETPDDITSKARMLRWLIGCISEEDTIPGQLSLSLCKDLASE